MQKALTDKTIEALKPEQKRYEVHDLRCPGLSLRITPNGRKTFTIKFRYGLQQKRMKLGVYPFRQIVPMLLATAQRRGELTEMRWSEIDLEEKVWGIPAERAKNGKKHYVPFSTFALALLDEVPRFLDCDYVFTTTRQSPVSGYPVGTPEDLRGVTRGPNHPQVIEKIW